MHTLFAAFFACLFGFNHAPAVAVATPASATDTRFVIASEHLQGRYDATSTHGHTVYAEDRCVSCRRTNVIYHER